MERAIATGYRVAETSGSARAMAGSTSRDRGMFLYDKTETYVPKPARNRSYLAAAYPRLVLPDGVTEDGWWNRPLNRKSCVHPMRAGSWPNCWRLTRAPVTLVLPLSAMAASSTSIMGDHGPSGEDPEEEHDPVWFAASNASITAITFTEDQRVVEYLNRVDFLPADLIT